MSQFCVNPESPTDIDTVSAASFRDVKSSGTAGGTATINTWNQRVLNSLVDSGTGVTLSSNDLVVPAGTWLISFQCPVFNVNFHQTRLYNSTDSSVIAYGSSSLEFNGINCTSVSALNFVFILAATKHIQIQHNVSLSNGANDFGYPVGNQFSPVSPSEVYTTGHIIKLA